MKIKQILAMVTTAALLLVSSHSNAAGFAIIENSASGMGNSFAGGAASAEDASTIWFNPAGMMRLDNEMLAAAHVIVPNAEFTDDGSTTAALMGSGQLDPTNTNRTADGGQNALVPNFYWVNEINKDLKMGFGVNVPFGLGTNYDDDWVGRYHAVKSDVMSLNLNPSIAYKMGAVSLGFGINAQYIHVELTSAIDLGTLCLAQEGTTFPSGYCASIGATPQGSDGFADLSASGWGYGYNLGVLYEVSKDVRVGFSYRSGIDHEVDGKADFSVPGELSFITENTGNFLDTTLTAAVTVPATTSISYFQNINDSVAIMVDYSLTSWSAFDELRVVYDDADSTDGYAAQAPSVTTEEWQDAARFSIGVNYQASDDWLYRFGVALDETPIPSAERRTPRIPGNDRTWISFGVTHQADSERSFSFAYAHLIVDDTAINNTFEASAAAPVLEHTLTGNYEASVDIISAQVSWKY
ncbi:MAG: OmpP1/FadL family transporter [Gammaproteobacteria bacterium]|nr:OmpP1/FadL family transporter [Gammaproteobacteria bacterium]